MSEDRGFPCAKNLMKLIEKKVPETRPKSKAMFMAYVPVVEEFMQSGYESALVSPEDGDEPPKKIAQRLQGAIKYLGGTEAAKVAVRTRNGDTYLARVER